MYMQLSNEIVPFPPPDGSQYFVRSVPGPRGQTATPVVRDDASSSYWVEACGMVPLPAPPEGWVYYAAVDPSRYATSELFCVLSPAPGDGFRTLWRYHGSRGRYAMIVPDWCTLADIRIDGIGPSVFDCPQRCLYSDGCANCNPSEFRTCRHGGCSGPAFCRVNIAAFGNDRCACASECRGCGDHHATHSMTAVYDEDGTWNGSRCRACIRNHFTACNHCSGYFPDADITWHETNCDERGGDDDDDAGSVHINDYSYTPHPLLFHGEAPFHLGVEVELNTGSGWGTIDEVASHFIDGMGDQHIYLKEDSSIGHGFELVTHPMTLEYATGEFPWGVLDSARTTYGLSPSEDCGMHVHVSRTAFKSASHIYRWMRLIYTNADKVQDLARRRNNSYASFRNTVSEWAIHWALILGNGNIGAMLAYGDTPWHFKTPAGRKRARQLGTPGYAERYSAVNVTPSQTVELRFFANTVNSVEVIAAMGFVHASVEYTRGLNANKVITEKALSFDAFSTWVRDNNDHGMYTHLISEIQRLVR